jgi:hypothetical protein
LANGVREVYIYYFNEKKRETILSFSKKDGIISHCKLIGAGSNLKVIYVKETRSIYEFDITKKATTLVGLANDAVLAMHVNSKNLRTFDRD